MKKWKPRPVSGIRVFFDASKEGEQVTRTFEGEGAAYAVEKPGGDLLITINGREVARWNSYNWVGVETLRGGVTPSS